MIKTRNITKALMSLVEDDARDPQVVAENFMRFAKKYHMEGRVKGILSAMENEVEKKQAYETVFITTVSPVSSEVIEDIKQYLKVPSNTAVHTSVDKNILGGFRVVYKNVLHEYSLQSRLYKLRTCLQSRFES